MSIYCVMAGLLCAACGYILGSINTSLIVGKFYKVDVRQHGSGNAGATNVLRTLGKKAAIFTFLGDFLKGVIACLAGRGLVALILLFTDATGIAPINHTVGLMIAGAFCIFGHNWPVFFGFKGGKGVLTTFAVFIMMAPIPALIALLFFVIIVAITRYVSLASMLTAVFLPLLVYLSGIFQWNVGVENITEYLIFCIPLALLIIVKHKKNIIKLIHGKENKLGKKKEVE